MDISEKDLKKIEKLERKLHRAILAIRKAGEGFSFSKQWNIVDECRKEIIRISGDRNYPTE